MLRNSTSDNSSSTGAPLVGSILMIVVVTIIVTTTINASVVIAANKSNTPTANVSSAFLSWSESASYPITTWTSSCVQSGGYIYCVGGLTGPNTVTNTTA